MTFELNSTVTFSDLPAELVSSLFDAAAQTVTIPEQFQFSIAIVDDDSIEQMNKTYRHKDKPTDVLSFRYSDDSGEIVLSADTIRKQAKEFGHSVQVEAAFMLVHGILHILGWDHERSEQEAREMRALEHSILKQCQLAFAR